MLYNKRFTNRVTRSVLEIRIPPFYARKRSGFVFPKMDRVTRLVNRYYKLNYQTLGILTKFEFPTQTKRKFALITCTVHNAKIVKF